MPVLNLKCTFIWLTWVIVSFANNLSSVSMLGAYGDITQGCNNLNRTTYLRSGGMRIQELPRSTISAVSLNQCAKQCTLKANALDCRAFEYNAASQTCTLQSAQGQPFGSSIVASTNDPGVAFFQQICIASEELCAAPYTFERYPQRLLTGQALQVLSTDGLSECLSLCLEARHKLKIDCRSLMFYYETGECILNRETKKELPHAFTNNTKFQLVDYFENNCYDVACFGNNDVHWIKAEDFYISIEKEVIVNGLTIDECKQACTENMIAAEIFPCRAFVYLLSKQECRLTADSGVVRKAVGDPSINFDDGSSGRNRVNAELSAISAGQYFEKFCIEGPVRCTDTSFEYISNKMLNLFDKTVTVKSVNICLHMCLLADSECNSVMYLRDTNKCIINKKTKLTDPELFRPAVNVDYFDKICDYEPGTFPILNNPVKNVFSNDESFMSLSSNLEPTLMQFEGRQNETPNLSSSIISSNKLKPVHAAVEKVKGTLETECRLDSIIVNAKFEEPTTGTVFIKDHSSTCHQFFSNAMNSQLTIPFLSALDLNPRCPGVKLASNLWSFVVVVQKNNLGIPSLITESDRIFNVTCDYSNTAVGGESQDLQQETDIFVTVKNTEQQVTKIHMAVLRNGLPVTTVALGEDLELKWTIESAFIPNAPKYGYFIDECFAERLDGFPPDPPPLRLIYQGCPDKLVQHKLIEYPIVNVKNGYSTHLKAFRFDGSRRVRIRCAVNICADQCAPTTCDMSSTLNATLSYGKRKKRQTVADLQNFLLKYHDAKLKGDVLLSEGEDNEEETTTTSESLGSTLEQSLISGTFTILENDVKAVAAVGSKNLKTSLPLDVGILTVPSADYSVTLANNLSLNADSSQPIPLTSQNKCILAPDKNAASKVCLSRSTVTGFLAFFGILSTLQLLSFINCMRFRHSTIKKYEDKNSLRASILSNTGTTSTEFYSGSYNNNSIINNEKCLVRDISLPNTFSSNGLKTYENKIFYSNRFINNHSDHSIEHLTSEL